MAKIPLRRIVERKPAFAGGLNIFLVISGIFVFPWLSLQRFSKCGGAVMLPHVIPTSCELSYVRIRGLNAR